MKNRRFDAAWLVMVALAAFSLQFGGCAKKPPQPAEKEIVWPDPPDPPRIKFVTGIYNSDDLGKSGLQSFLDASTGKSRGTRISKPYGVYVDAANRLYVADVGWGRVLVFDQNTRAFRMIGEELSAKLSRPFAVTGDREGNLYVADFGEQKIKCFGPAPGYALRWSAGRTGDFQNPTGLAVHEASKRLWVVDTKNYRLRVLDLDGNFLFDLGGPGEGSGRFNLPTNIAINQTSNEIYVMDTMNFRVQVFNQDGAFLRQFGCHGDSWGCFARPKGIALDREGHVYVSDALFHNVQIFTADGKVALFFSRLGVGPGELQSPTGMAFGPDDRLYVADQLNHRIQVFQYLPQPE